MSTIRQGIKNDRDVKYLLDQTTPNVSGISPIGQRYLDADKVLSGAKLEVDYYTAENVTPKKDAVEQYYMATEFEIRQEKDDKGKFVYNNDAQRKMATNKTLAMDEGYIALVNELAQAKHKEKEKKMHLGKCYAQMKMVTLEHQNIITALNTIAGLCTEGKLDAEYYKFKVMKEICNV